MSNSNKVHSKFWLKLAIIATILLLMHGAMLLIVDGRNNIALYKVSGEKKQNLIIGSSRIAQALNPDVFYEQTQRDFLNLAISLSSTSYSEMYNEVIFEKLDENTSDGIFILALDPWIISRKYDECTNKELYPENDDNMANLWSYNTPLNVQFLIKDYQYAWGNILVTNLRNNATVIGHKNGWIEVTRPLDQETVDRKKKSKITGLKENAKEMRLSFSRLQALHELVSFLKTKGKVFFVRLPIDQELYEIENNFMPNFTDIAQRIEVKYDAPFLDLQYLSKDVLFNDGHHINKKFSPFISSKIIEWIDIELNKKKQITD